jgi:multidrug resistance efflux pump
MWMTKIKVVATVVLAVSAAGFGAGVVLSKAAQPGAGTNAGQAAPIAAAAKDEPAARREVTGDAPPRNPSKSPKEEEEKGAERKKVPLGSLEEAQFDVDLMKAQLEAKEAELLAAKEAAERAKADLARVERLGKAAAISQAEVDAAKAQADAALAQVRIREAELRVPEVRLRQAQHRLTALRGAPAAPAGKPADAKDPLKNSDAREAVELMEAQVAIQRARLAEAKAEAEAAKIAVDRFAGNEGITVPAQDKVRAETDARTKLAQVQVREAELAEAEVRLKHARRRAEEPSKASGGDAPRVEELQKKIDQLQKELETLKKK